MRYSPCAGAVAPASVRGLPRAAARARGPRASSRRASHHVAQERVGGDLERDHGLAELDPPRRPNRPHEGAMVRLGRRERAEVVHDRRATVRSRSMRRDRAAAATRATDWPRRATARADARSDSDTTATRASKRALNRPAPPRPPSQRRRPAEPCSAPRRRDRQAGRRAHRPRRRSRARGRRCPCGRRPPVRRADRRALPLLCAARPRSCARPAGAPSHESPCRRSSIVSFSFTSGSPDDTCKECLMLYSLGICCYNLLMSEHNFLLQRVQPAMVGLIDGSLSTLAPIFGIAIYTHSRTRPSSPAWRPRSARPSRWPTARVSRTPGSSPGAGARSLGD